MGTCYIMAAIASMATKFPNLVKEVFINDYNDQGIYAVRFYIRGKPWIITIDDNMLYNN